MKGSSKQSKVKQNVPDRTGQEGGGKKLLEQFKRISSEVIVDDLKIIKSQSKYLSIHLQQKQKLMKFVKSFRYSKKDELIELIDFLVQKFISQANLKICLEAFVKGDQVNDQAYLFPIYGILDEYNAKIMVEQTRILFQKNRSSENYDSVRTSAMSQSQTATFNHQSSVMSQTFDISQTSSTSKTGTFNQRDSVSGQSQQSIEDKLILQKSEGQKKQLKIQKKLSNSHLSKLSQWEGFILMLMTGNFQSLSQESIPRQFKQKFEKELLMFYSSCSVIKDVITFLNDAFLEKSERVEDRKDLNLLAICLQNVRRKGNEKIGKSMALNIREDIKESMREDIIKESMRFKRNKMWIQSFTCHQSYDPEEDFVPVDKEKKRLEDALRQSDMEKEKLDKALKQAQKLFNKKSMEHSIDSKNFNEAKMRMMQLSTENHEMREKIVQLEQRIDQMRKLQVKLERVQKVRQQNQAKLRQQLLQIESLKQSRQLNNGGRVQSQLMEKLNESQKQRRKLIDEAEMLTRETKEIRKQWQKDVERKQAQISTMKKQRDQLKSVVNSAMEMRQDIRKQNEFVMQDYQQLKVSHQKLQHEYTSLMSQNKQIMDSNNQLRQSYKTLQSQYRQTLKESLSLKSTQESQSQPLSSEQLELVSQAVSYFTRLNMHLETSEILSPLSYVTLSKYIQRSIDQRKQSNGKELKQVSRSDTHETLVRKEFLINSIQEFVSHNQRFGSSTIRAFRLIYRWDDKIKASFHEFIDNTAKFLVLIKLTSGAIIGGYSHEALQKGVRTNLGFMFSLNLLQNYYLKDKYCLIYDDYYLVFGNSQIRIRMGQNLFYSNFGIAKAHFEVNQRNFSHFLMAGSERQLPFEYFEVYKVIFQDTQ